MTTFGGQRRTGKGDQGAEREAREQFHGTLEERGVRRGQRCLGLWGSCVGRELRRDIGRGTEGGTEPHLNLHWNKISSWLRPGHDVPARLVD